MSSLQQTTTGVMAITAGLAFLTNNPVLLSITSLIETYVGTIEPHEVYYSWGFLIVFGMLLRFMNKEKHGLLFEIILNLYVSCIAIIISFFYTISLISSVEIIIITKKLATGTPPIYVPIIYLSVSLALIFLLQKHWKNVRDDMTGRE